MLAFTKPYCGLPEIDAHVEKFAVFVFMTGCGADEDRATINSMHGRETPYNAILTEDSSLGVPVDLRRILPNNTVPTILSLVLIESACNPTSPNSIT